MLAQLALCSILLTGNSLQAKDVSEVFWTTQKQFFPQLSEYNVQLLSFRGKRDTYFYTDVDRVFRSRKNRIYKVYYDLRILESPPSREALQAILAHELQHISDYTKFSFWNLAMLLMRYEVLGDEKFICRFERNTDRLVISLGLGEALADYRQWLYARLDKKYLKRKRQRYLQPHEIQELISLTNVQQNQAPH